MRVSIGSEVVVNPRIDKIKGSGRSDRSFLYNSLVWRMRYCYFVGFIMAKFCRTLIMQRLVEILGLGLRSVFNIFFGHLFAGYLLRLWQSLNAQRSLVFCCYLLVYNCLWFRLEAAIG